MRGVLPAPPTPEEEQALLERMALGDAAARDELITRNLLIVKSVALCYSNAFIEYEERFSLGCVGLIYAVDHFDGVRSKLTSYIARCAHGQILRLIRNRGMKKRAGMALSLDAPVASLKSEGSEEALGDVLPSKEPQPIERIETAEMYRALHAAVASLPEDMQRYLALRFSGDRKLSQGEAGKAFGWSQMTAHRREHAAFEACRAMMADGGFE